MDELLGTLHEKETIQSPLGYHRSATGWTCQNTLLMG